MITKVLSSLAAGTSFWGGTIRATYSSLIDIFGEPQYLGRGDISGKTQADWTLKTTSGIIFTVYDWKEYREWEDDEILEWHIGTKTQEETESVLGEIKEETGLAVNVR